MLRPTPLDSSGLVTRNEDGVDLCKYLAGRTPFQQPSRCVFSVSRLRLPWCSFERTQQEYALSRLRGPVVSSCRDHRTREVPGSLRIGPKCLKNMLVAWMENARNVLEHKPSGIGLQHESQKLVNKCAAAVWPGRRRLRRPTSHLSSRSRASISSFIALIYPVRCLAERLAGGAADDHNVLPRRQPSVSTKLLARQGCDVSEHGSPEMQTGIIRHRLARVEVVVDGQTEVCAGALGPDTEAACASEKIYDRKLSSHEVPFVSFSDRAATLRAGSDIAPGLRRDYLQSRDGAAAHARETTPAWRYARLMSPPRLSARQLYRQIESSLRSTQVSVLPLPAIGSKPFRFALAGNSLLEPTIARIYAWNVTHGGGVARATDEYRIQLTHPMPQSAPNEELVILGWSETHGVYVGWDPRVHEHRRSASPSLQVREEVMNRGALQGIAAAVRASGDVVVAFRADLLAAYCMNVRELHNSPELDTVRWLNAIGSTLEETDPGRPFVERRLRLAYRSWDFSARVRGAYDHRCAICGLGLGLVEGAHIVPVAWPGSTDSTSNGLALCRNHHVAYDRGLISVSPTYRVEVSSNYRNRRNHSEPDWQWLSDVHGSELMVVPRTPSERPDPEYLALGRAARRWAVDAT